MQKLLRSVPVNRPSAIGVNYSRKLADSPRIGTYKKNMGKRPARIAGNTPMVDSSRRNSSYSSIENSNNLIALIECKHGAWSAPELAELLGCSGKHIYALAKSGRIPHLRIGGMIRFDPCTTAAWLRERSIAA